MVTGLVAPRWTRRPGATAREPDGGERPHQEHECGAAHHFAGASYGARELDERAHAEAGTTLGEVAVVGVRARRTGDVEVHPRRAVDELLQEQSGRERAAVAAADVLEVGDLRLELLAVLGGQRERPHRFAGAVGGGADLVGPVVVVAHESGDLVAQRDHARAGEGREVDHRARLLVRREREGVGEDEATLGVGVEHLDRLAVADLQHVARTDGVAARHVLDQRDVTGHTRLHAQRAERRHRRDHRRATRHVGLHRLHAAGGLQRQTTGVEHHTLADECERLAACTGRARTSS